jgi:predicted negative regulator of RcsB-dependent stress response
VGSIIAWLLDDIWHLIAVVLALFVGLFYIGFQWESHQADKFQAASIKFENAFVQQKGQTELCEKNKSELLTTCNKNERTTQTTLSTCDKLLRACEKSKGGECFDEETLKDLDTITKRFNDGMRSESTSPTH